MAVLTGDLMPRGSGAASLGVEQVGVCGMTNEITPYCHVHQISGVFHGMHGGSGIIRYRDGWLEKSDNGGLTFLPIVGNLDEVYHGGNEVEIHSLPAGPASAAANFSTDQQPIVLQSATPGGGTRGTVYAERQTLAAASIVASGYTDTPNLRHTFSYAAMGPGYLALQGSGTLAAPTDAGWLAITALNDDLFGSAVTMTSSGVFTLESDRGVFIIDRGEGDLLAGIQIDSRGPIIANGLGGQLSLRAFSSSGQLEYRFGPHQSWYMKRTHSSTSGPFGDGFEPLVPSGSIVQMILENSTGGISTLQEAYEGDNNIFTSLTQGGPVNLAGTTAAPLSLYVGNATNIPHIHMSGLIGAPNLATERGDFWMQNHTAAASVMLNGLPYPSTQAAADAFSLGPAMPFYHTGSGVTNLMIASGIGCFLNLTPIALSQDQTVSLDETNDISPAYTSDHFFTPVNNSGVRVNVAGTYRIDYLSAVEKTGGSLAQSASVLLTIRDRFGNENTLTGANNTVYIRNSNRGLNLASVGGHAFVDLETSETVLLQFTTEATPFPNIDTLQVPTNSALLCLTYIGPKRLGKLNR